MYSEIASLEMSISFDKLSPKQLICECLDNATTVLKQLINFYHQSKGETSPFASSTNDFYKIVNYALEPAMQDNLLTFYKIENNERYCIRTWLYELKSLRNTWAHSNTLEFRQAHRAFDTLELLVSKLGANKETELYRKLNTYRKLLAVKIAQEYINEDKQKHAHLNQNPVIFTNSQPNHNAFHAAQPIQPQHFQGNTFQGYMPQQQGGGFGFLHKY